MTEQGRLGLDYMPIDALVISDAPAPNRLMRGTTGRVEIRDEDPQALIPTLSGGEWWDGPYQHVVTWEWAHDPAHSLFITSPADERVVYRPEYRSAS